MADGPASGTSFVALLRAVNVGGTGKLAMDDLRRLAADCGFSEPRTYIASGNLLFRSPKDEQLVRTLLEERLHAHLGKAVPVFVRTADEIAQVAASDPFPDEPGSRHMVSFLHEPPPSDVIERMRGWNGERIALGAREIFVAYGDGIRHTKLVIPKELVRTARNMNSVKKLAELAGGLA